MSVLGVALVVETLRVKVFSPYKIAEEVKAELSKDSSVQFLNPVEAMQRMSGNAPHVHQEGSGCCQPKRAEPEVDENQPPEAVAFNKAKAEVDEMKITCE